jgi:DNA-binding transcriptional MerR regulator
MSVQTQENAYRIGEVAQRVGVTTRTIRYYEELGLLGSDAERPKGAHRLYSEANITRLQDLIRLRDVLGLSLDELVELAEAEESCALLKDQWEKDPDDEERLRILHAARPLIERQLELVRQRQETLSAFAHELEEKLATVHERTAELNQAVAVTER